jgi:hypothetical protein
LATCGPIVNRPNLRRFPICAQDTILDTIQPHASPENLR